MLSEDELAVGSHESSRVFPLITIFALFVEVVGVYEMSEELKRLVVDLQLYAAVLLIAVALLLELGLRDLLTVSIGKLSLLIRILIVAVAMSSIILAVAVRVDHLAIDAPWLAELP